MLTGAVAKAVDDKVDNAADIATKRGDDVVKVVEDKADDVTKAASDAAKMGEKPYSGEDWCRYLREKYGNENVVWEDATPSQLARSWQGVGDYKGVDAYVDKIVKKGEVLYRGEPYGTEYFTTRAEIEKCSYEAKNIFEELQVKPHKTLGYKSEMMGYVFNEDVATAYGITRANLQFGPGGLAQYYVPNVKELIEKGVLVPVEKVMLIK